ncbi:hypothetical protein [Nostoc sp. ATCC 53789]|uniref:hypothetical protein n=1 Tax=Nostoc sp. ATCC 53789 TaxID=76335 RepID=UPI000DECD88B|nr:hypothetical protein [Nostoc sp. ATCC 53789]QHG20576.1 hypothetical protein GJB62_32275 [Nostoc sp. ATCC 53789]RCJ33245.1 hypothetical protein A6V25_34635 [Nostoc sp. ATCC 53789]
MKYLVIALILVAVLLPIGISLASIPRLHFHENPDKMEQEVLRVILLGAAIADAKKIMERNWFKCEIYENSTFIRYRKIPGNSESETKLFSHVDFILCTRKKGFIVKQNWIVGIIYEKERVTTVVVNYGLTGS